MSDEEEEPVCLKPAIEAACASHCTDFKAKLDACAERIRGKGEGYDCRGQAHDMFRCIDHCASPSVFNNIK